VTCHACDFRTVASVLSFCALGLLTGKPQSHFEHGPFPWKGPRGKGPRTVSNQKNDLGVNALAPVKFQVQSTTGCHATA
jgi:hypothetical protein